ncbi:MAG: hypothetical protein WC367_00935 [Methanoregula sp.]|jgi:hypothetical protein
MAKYGEDTVFGYRLATTEETRTPLSLAIRLLDEASSKSPKGQVSIRVKNSTVRPVRNRSGDYLFFRLVPGQDYTFQVLAELYESEEITVKIPDHAGINKMNPAQMMKKFLRVISLKQKKFE